MSMDQLLKKYKDYISSADQVREKFLYSLGPLSVNLAVGNPEGVPGGKIVQIVGRQSSGKSTLALDIVKQFQSRYPEWAALYVDFERSFDPTYALSCGVDLTRLHIVRPDTTERGLSIAEEGVDKYDVKLVLIDSIAAAMPASELTKDYDDNVKMASNAGLITRFCNRMVHKLDDSGALLVMLNQLRMNFNTLSQEKEVPFGGMALQYATSVSLHLTRIAQDKEEITTQVIVKKNKVGSPQTRAEFKIVYGLGIDSNRDIIDLAVNVGAVKKSGAWFSYGDYKAQGAIKAAASFPIDNIRDLVVQLYRKEEADHDSE